METSLITKLYNGTLTSVERTLLERVVTNHVAISKAEGQPATEVDHIINKLKEMKKP